MMGQGFDSARADHMLVGLLAFVFSVGIFIGVEARPLIHFLSRHITIH